MPSLILPRRFYSQPQGLVELSDFAKLSEIKTALINSYGLLVDVNNSPLLVSGGAGTRGYGVNSNGATRTYSAAADYILDGGRHATPEYMWVFVGSITTLATWSGIISRTSDNNTAQGYSWQRNSSLDALRAYHAGGVTIGADYCELGNVSEIANGELISLVGIGKAGGVRLYKNGVLFRSGSLSKGPTISAGAGQLKIGSSRDTAGLTGAINLVAFGNKYDELLAKEISSNPWQLFLAPKRVLYFDVGGTTDTPSAASSGSLSIIGSAANGLEAKLSAASSSSYTLTGSNAAGLIARASAAGSSSYTITGVAASGVKESAGDTPSAANSGNFTISGVSTSGVRALKAAADSSSYTLTGSNANGLVSRGADASSGSYTITGVAAEGQWIHVSNASSDAFVITGVDAIGVKSGAISLTQADLDAIAAAVWADATAVAAHAKLDAIIARLTC